MILAIAKMDVTVVMATLADSNMTEEGQCHSRDLSTNIRQFTILSVRKKMDIIAEPAGKARQRSSIGREGEGSPKTTRRGYRECHLFLARNCAVLLGDWRFSWREIA